MGRIIFILSCLLMILTNLHAEQVSGNLTTIKSSVPKSDEVSLDKKVNEKIQEVISSSKSESNSQDAEQSKVSGWMKDNMNVGLYATRLSNAYGCFNGFVKNIISVRLKAYDLTVACGLQGSKYCQEQQAAVASSQLVTDQFYSCLDGKTKTSSVADAK